MQPTETSPSRRRAPAAVALIVLAAAMLRGYLLTDQSLWLDEIMTVNLSAGRGMVHDDLPVGQVIDSTPRFGNAFEKPWWTTLTTPRPGDAHPPLLYLLLRLWGEMFGDSDLAMRAFPMFWSLVSIPLMYVFARLLLGDTRAGVAAALWACVLMAVASPQIQYAQEVRGYTLLQVQGLCACIALVLIEKRGPTPWRCAGLSASVLCMMLTHYFAFGAALAMGVYALVRLRGNARRQAILAFAVAAIVYLVAWGPSLWDQRHTFATTTHLRVNYTNHLERTLVSPAMFPVRCFADPSRQYFAVAALGAIAFVVPFLLLRRRPELLLPGLLITLTVGMLMLLDLTQSTSSLELFRYQLIAAPAIYLIAAAPVLAKKTGPWRHALPALMACYCLLMIQHAYREKGEWRGVGAYVDENARPRDAFVLYYIGAQPWLPRANLVCLSRYSNAIHGARTLMLLEPPTDQAVRQIRTSPRIWVLTNSPDVNPADVFGGVNVLQPIVVRNIGAIWLIEPPSP